MPHTTELVIAADHPAYEGHFPGTPILPAVVLLDAALHAAARLHPSPAAQWQVLTAKFHNVVRPGDALTLEHETAPNGTIRFVIRNPNRDATPAVASGVLKPTAPTDEPEDGERAR